MPKRPQSRHCSAVPGPRHRCPATNNDVRLRCLALSRSDDTHVALSCMVDTAYHVMVTCTPCPRQVWAAPTAGVAMFPGRVATEPAIPPVAVSCGAPLQIHAADEARLTRAEAPAVGYVSEKPTEPRGSSGLGMTLGSSGLRIPPPP